MDSNFEINKGMINRYEKTLSFIQIHIPNTKKILDLGICNPFSDILKEKGYEVFNTHDEDLDYHPEVVKQYNGIEYVTALEICEHLINPMGVLSQLPSDNLFASIPLSLWFAKVYRSKINPWNRHFLEFEDWQFDWLLEKV